MLTILFNTVQLLASGFAGWRGGAPERVVAAGMLVAAAATAALPWSRATAFASVHLGLVAVDVGFLLFLTAVALAANRYWPIWIAAVQLVAVASHGVRAYDRTIWMRAYWLVSSESAYIMIALLLIGTIRHRRRVRSGLPEAGWYWPSRGRGDAGNRGSGFAGREAVRARRQPSPAKDAVAGRSS